MEADRRPADLLDQLEDLLALLLAHGVAEDSAEQADVLPQRAILIRVVVDGTGHTSDLGETGHRRIRLAEVLRWCTAADFVARPKDRQKQRNLRALAQPQGLREPGAEGSLVLEIAFVDHERPPTHRGVS